MIIYNKEWLRNYRLQRDANEQFKVGNISIDELNGIRKTFVVGFSTTGIFVRVGMFVLTLIAASFSYGLLCLMVSNSQIFSSPGWPIFLGVCTVILLEVMVKANHYYSSGIDDALLYMAFGLMTGGFIFGVSKLDITSNTAGLLDACLVFVLASMATLRYADTFTGITAYLSGLAIIFFGWQNLGSFGLATMPFIMMAASAASYFWFHRSNKQHQAADYEFPVLAIRVISLLTLYAAGNYFVVQYLGDQLNAESPQMHKPVPLGFIFWGWTILLPFAYIAAGIWKRELLLIRTGLILIAAAVFTFRNYYHLLPVELMLTIAGIMVLALVYGLIKYLKTPRHNFTYEDINDSESSGSLQIESLVIGETFGHLPSGPVQQDNVFGGGSAGGGGSSSNY